MLMNSPTTAQQHMQQLGVSDTQLERIYHHLQPTLPAAKISGSGLGDCVLGFGHLIEPQPYPFLNTQLSNLGAVCQPLED